LVGEPVIVKVRLRAAAVDDETGLIVGILIRYFIMAYLK